MNTVQKIANEVWVLVNSELAQEDVLVRYFSDEWFVVSDAILEELEKNA